jgi:hypothetical protein
VIGGTKKRRKNMDSDMGKKKTRGIARQACFDFDFDLT